MLIDLEAMGRKWQLVEMIIIIINYELRYKPKIKEIKKKYKIINIKIKKNDFIHINGFKHII